ncbi:hypothetical protein BROUX41_003445 [Berkeleyomyces rouxiae]|uniref:uncharacterized protein n=1 Tax=Berkeleyomyces rouxiae TaxID=2035830 RepID=UPI003B794AFD
MPRIILLTGAPLASALLDEETTSSAADTTTNLRAWTKATPGTGMARLLLVFEPCYARIDKSLPLRQNTAKGHADASALAATPPSQWRLLPLHRTHLPTGLSQGLYETDFLNPALLQAPNAADFTRNDSSLSPSILQSMGDGEGLTTLLNQSWSCVLDDSSVDIDPTTDNPGDNTLLQFYEESLLLYSALDDTDVQAKTLSHPRSTPPPPTRTSALAVSSLENDTDISDYTWLSTTASNPPHSPTPSLQTFRPGASRPPSNLKDLPSSAQLSQPEPTHPHPHSRPHAHPRAAAPFLVNLIVGIISISPPRTITTRWGTRLQLVELLVGDDTRAGFSVSFWLPPAQTPNHATLLALRRQDIVLLHNVLLASFAGRVFGQSVRGGDTAVNLLYRHQRLSETSHPGHYSAADLRVSVKGRPQLEKTRRVREWVVNSVAGGMPDKRAADVQNADSGRQTKRQIQSWDRPPADSQ